jgi:photosystem II stability/assembly factor-like uncharacterized protein
VAACGTECVACASLAIPHAASYTCAGNTASAAQMCRVTCEPGWRPTPAGTACEACDDLGSCGLECAPCPVDPVGAEYTCATHTLPVAQACEQECDPGFVLVSGACRSNRWVLLDTGATSHLTAVAFADAQRGLIAGDGALFRSADGGKTWTASSLALVSPALAFPAAGAAFLAAGAASGAARVLKSTDGGATWSASLSGTGYAITRLAFASASVGWAAGATSGASPVLYATTDGGATWTALTAPGTLAPLALARTSALGLWGAADGVYRSTDGGATWSGPAPLEAGVPLTAREPRGLHLGAALAWATTACSAHRSADGGASFAGTALLCDESDFAAIHFPNASDGWIAGAQDEQSISPGVIFVTHDGGLSWTDQPGGNIASNHLRALYMIDALRGWAVGDSGTVIYTNSGGEKSP